MCPRCGSNDIEYEITYYRNAIEPAEGEMFCNDCGLGGDWQEGGDHDWNDFEKDE